MIFELLSVIEIADGVRPNVSAASTILPASATATKVRNAATLMTMRDGFINSEIS